MLQGSVPSADKAEAEHEEWGGDTCVKPRKEAKGQTYRCTNDERWPRYALVLCGPAFHGSFLEGSGLSETRTLSVDEIYCTFCFRTCEECNL